MSDDRDRMIHVRRARARRRARIVGVLVSAVWLVPLLGHALGGEDEYAAEGNGSGEGWVLGVLVLSAMAATAVAFRDERRGGLVLVALGGGLFLAAARRRSADPG